VLCSFAQKPWLGEVEALTEEASALPMPEAFLGCGINGVVGMELDGAVQAHVMLAGIVTPDMMQIGIVRTRTSAMGTTRRATKAIGTNRRASEAGSKSHRATKGNGTGHRRASKGNGKLTADNSKPRFYI
jgi:hypothetical protein